MPGPMPKDPALRQRRNKATTRAVLAVSTAPMKRPELPARAGGEAWHPLSIQWWDAVWASPQAQQFLPSDLGALFRLVNLVDLYWKTGKLALALEIRLLEREFGLTPLSRRRLEWTVVQVEEAADRRDARQVKGAKVIDATARDPREVLDQ